MADGLLYNKVYDMVNGVVHGVIYGVVHGVLQRVAHYLLNGVFSICNFNICKYHLL